VGEVDLVGHVELTELLVLLGLIALAQFRLLGLKGATLALVGWMKIQTGYFSYQGL